MLQATMVWALLVSHGSDTRSEGVTEVLHRGVGQKLIKYISGSGGPSGITASLGLTRRALS